MSAADEPIILSVSESWDLLERVALGRLVTDVEGRPEIFPVNFAVQRRTVLFRTAEGTKLASAAINSRVLFEADDYNPVEGWSVIVSGAAQILRSSEEIQEAQQARLLPWTGWSKPHYVRILPVSITGRRFEFGREPRQSTLE